jgi:hypothetical protein
VQLQRFLNARHPAQQPPQQVVGTCYLTLKQLLQRLWLLLLLLVLLLSSRLQL